MTAFVVRPYQPADEAAVIDVWNRALGADPIGVGTWRARVLLDPNFDPAGCLVAEAEGAARGFLLSLTRRVPFYTDGLQPDQAWITAFAVDPAWQGRGLGGALLAAALDRLRGLGRATVSIAPYVPGYFTPGVDVAAYDGGLDFLERHGFRVVARPLNMRAELTAFQPPPAIVATAARLAEQGVGVRPATPADITPLLAFVEVHFGWDWVREAAGVLGDLFTGDPRAVGLLVAARGDEILGYAQHRGERFGPFGVRADLRSQGMGRVLLAATLAEMLKRGYHAAWFLWTSDNAARLYATCGFHEVRRFAVLRATLEQE